MNLTRYRLSIMILFALVWIAVPPYIQAQSEPGEFRIITPEQLFKTFEDYFNQDSEGKVFLQQIEGLKIVDKMKYDVLFNSVLTIKNVFDNINYNEKNIESLDQLSKAMSLVLPPIFNYYNKVKSTRLPPEEVVIIMSRFSDLVLQGFESKYKSATSSGP